MVGEQRYSKYLFAKKKKKTDIYVYNNVDI